MGSFIGKFKNELMNGYFFDTFNEARVYIEHWLWNIKGAASQFSRVQITNPRGHSGQKFNLGGSKLIGGNST